MTRWMVDKRIAAWERQFDRKLAPEDPAFGINWFEAVDVLSVVDAAVRAGGIRSVL